MNEKNFNSISQFEVPKSWIDGALDVPSSHTKKPFPFIKLTRTIAAVACFVLVCGLSVALYFITDDSSIPPVKSPDFTNTQYVDDSCYTGESDTDSTQNNKKPDKNVSVNPTSSGSHFEKNEDKNENNSGSHPEPNEKPTKPQKPTTNKPDKPDSTQYPTNVDPPIDPLPTNPEYEPPSEPEYEPPTESFTEGTGEWPSPTEGPTRPKPPYEPTENSTESGKPPWVTPTMPETKPPTEDPTNPQEKPNFYNFDVYALLGANRVAATNIIYCALYDSNGRLLGDSNLYSSSHIAIKGETSNGRTRVMYYPYRYINIPKDGVYTYVFYNSKGEQMWSNTCYLRSNI